MLFSQTNVSHLFAFIVLTYHWDRRLFLPIHPSTNITPTFIAMCMQTLKHAKRLRISVWCYFDVMTTSLPAISVIWFHKESLLWKWRSLRCQWQQNLYYYITFLASTKTLAKAHREHYQILKLLQGLKLVNEGKFSFLLGDCEVS